MAKTKRNISLKKSTYEVVPNGFVLEKKEEIKEKYVINNNAYYGIYYLLDKKENEVSCVEYNIYYKNDNKQFSDRVLYIFTLFTEIEHRNKGLGTFLLMEVIRDANKCGIKRVILDDASDNWGKERNVYKNIGLYYKYKSDSSMTGNIRAILKKRRRVN